MKNINIYLIFIFAFLLSIDGRATSCIGWGELDLLEFIEADLIAEISVSKYEKIREGNRGICIAKILKVYRNSEDIEKEITLSSNFGDGTYLPSSGTMLVWAYKNPDGTYSTNSCTRSFRISVETDYLNYIVNRFRNKRKKRAQLKFLNKYRNRTSKINVLQDGKLIKGRLKKGMPIGTWEISSTKGQIVTKIDFCRGLKDGQKVVYDSASMLLVQITNFKNGNKHGTSFRMHENGSIKEQIIYDKGLSNGKEIQFYDTGQVNYIGMNIGGVKDGRWKYFRNNGTLEKEFIYIIRQVNTYSSFQEDQYLKIIFLYYNKKEELINEIIHDYDEIKLRNDIQH